MGKPESEALLGYLESPKFTQAASNSSRLVVKLKNAIGEGQLYETHQILRTVYFRFNNVEEKVGPLLDLLYHGSVFLIKNQEFISGQDIGLLLLEVAAKRLQQRQAEAKSNPTLNEDIKSLLNNSSLTDHMTRNTLDVGICQNVARLAVSLPDGEHNRVKFVAETFKLLSPKLLNRDLLHNTLANMFWQAKDYLNARYHFLHCANMENAGDIANLLIEYHSQSALKSEVDLFITQFILQLLCLQHPLDSPEPPNSGAFPSSSHLASRRASPSSPPNAIVTRKTRTNIRSIASVIFTTYTSKHPDLLQIEGPFSSLPLLNFTRFIIDILDAERPEPTAYQMLNDIYKVSWSRDPDYHNYLTRIGTLYFGLVDIAKQQQLQQQQRAGGGFFNNILMSLLDNADEDTDGEGSNHQGNNNGNSNNNNLSPCDELD